MKNIAIPLFIVSALLPVQLTRGVEGEIQLSSVTVFPRNIPKGQIEISTVEYQAGDQPATREDWPFTLSYVITNLSTSPTAEPAEKQVQISRSGLYQTYTNGVLLNGPETPFANSPATVGGGVALPTTQVFPQSALSFVAENGFAGKQVYRISTLASPAAVPPTTSEVIASAALQIWPKPNGKLQVVGTETSFLNDAPPIFVAVQNRYPGSVTFVQIYSGEKQGSVGLKGNVIPGTFFNTDYSFSCPTESKEVADWYPLVTSRGKWTLELISLTRLKSGATLDLATLSGPAGASKFGNTKGSDYQIQNLPTGNIAGVEAGTYLIERNRDCPTVNFPEIATPLEIKVRASVTTAN